MTATRILIAEDEAVTALDISDSLKALGYDPLPPVATGKDVVEAATAEKPELILMDIRLKGEMDGIAAASQIMEEAPVPIIFLTAYSDEETLSRAKLAHPYGFILKPYDEDELNACIQIALANFSTHHKQEVARRPFSLSGAQSGVVTLGSKELTPGDFLKRVDPFRGLSDESLGELARGAVFKKLAKNEKLCAEGDADAPIFIVASGRVALLKSSVSGKELTVGLLPPGDIFGVVAHLNESDCPYTIVAHEEVSLLLLPHSTLRLVLDEHPEFYKEFNDEMKERLDGSHTLALRLAHEKVDVRIAAALVELTYGFGRTRIDDDHPIVIVTRQQLAQIAGTTPETAIRFTKSMEQDGLLDLSTAGQIRIMDMSRLEGLLELGAPRLD